MVQLIVGQSVLKLSLGKATLTDMKSVKTSKNRWFGFLENQTAEPQKLEFPVLTAVLTVKI